MKKLLFFFSLALCLNANSLTKIEYDLVQNVIPNTKILNAKKSLIDGLYEVQTDKNIIYVYPYKRLLFFGEMMSADNGKILTGLKPQLSNKQRLLKELKPQEVNSLLSGALKAGEVKGDFNFIVFKSPTCPNCYVLDKYFDRHNLLRHNFYNGHKLSHKILRETYKIMDTQKELDNHFRLSQLVKPDAVPYILITDKNNKLIDVIKGANLMLLNAYLPEKNKKADSKEFLKSFYQVNMKEAQAYITEELNKLR